MEEPDEEWEDNPLPPKENGKVSWILRKGLGLGKKILISGIVITSAPFIVPPLVVFSAFGLAFSVPFGIYFVSYACTEKIMSKLLSTPMSPPDVPEYDIVLLDDVEISCGGDAEEDMGFVEVIDFEKEEERLRNDVEKVVEMRIELQDQGNEGFYQERKLAEVENDEHGGFDSEEHEPMEDDVNEVLRDELCEEEDEDLKKENVKPLRETDAKSEGVIEEETVGYELADGGNEGFDHQWKPTEVEGYDQGDVVGREHEPIKNEGYEEDGEDLVKDIKKSFEEIDMKMKGHKEDEIVEEEAYDKEENLAQEQVMSVREIDMEMDGKREEEIVNEEGYKKDEELANGQVISLEEIDMNLEGDSENGNVKEEGYAKDEDLAKTIFEAPDDKIITDGDDENNAIVGFGELIGVNEENMGAEKPVDIKEGNFFVSETMGMKESVMRVDYIGTTAEDELEHHVREISIASHKRNAKKIEKRDKTSRIRKKFRTNKMDSAIKKKEEEDLNKLLETPEMNGGDFSSVPNIVEVEILPETRETAYVHTTVNEVNEQFDNEWKRTEVENYQQGGVDCKNHEPMNDGVKEIVKEDNQDLAKSQDKALVEIDMILEGDTKEDTLASVEEENTVQKSINEDLGDAMEVDGGNISTVNVGKPFELTRRFNEENEGTGKMIHIEEDDSKNGNHVDTIVEVEILQESREAGNIDSIVENEQNCNEYEKDKLEVKTESNGNNVEAVTFSNEDVRRNVDQNEFNLGENKNTVDEHFSSSVKEASEGTDQLPRYADEKIAADEALTVTIEVPESPSEKGATALSDKALYSEEKIWENILALGTIVGYKVMRQQTCMEELKAIYIFTGVEPPISSKNSSDLVELNDKLRFLMTVVGVK